MGEESKKREMNSLYTVLEKISFFKILPHDLIVQLSQCLKTRTYCDGEVIIKEGVIDECNFYIIVDGEVKMTKNTSPDSAVTILKSGNYFGEIALLSNAPRSANIIAVGAVETLVLDKDNFNKLLQPYFIKCTSARSISDANAGISAPKTEKYRPKKLDESKPLTPLSPIKTPKNKRNTSNRTLQLYIFNIL